jgi:hypothetical protein
MVEENLIISGLYSVFLLMDVQRQKRRKVLEKIKEIMNNEINNAKEKAKENKVYEEFVKRLEKLKEQIGEELEEIAVIELPVFKLPEHTIENRQYYVFPYLLEIRLDKPLIAYKENVVLENEEIRGYRDYEVKDLGVMRYRVKSV